MIIPVLAAIRDRSDPCRAIFIGRIVELFKRRINLLLNHVKMLLVVNCGVKVTLLYKYQLISEQKECATYYQLWC